MVSKILYGRVGSHVVAVAVSLLLHTGVIGLLLGNWATEEPRKRVTPSYIQATLLQLEEKPKPAPKVVDQAAKQRAEQQRIAEQKRIVEQKKIAEQKRKAEAERKKKEQQLAEERRRKEQAEREQREKQKREQEARQKAEQEKRRQQEFANALAAENELLQQQTDEQVAAAYSAYIRDRIASNWSRPPSARREMQVELLIQMLPNGQVSSVSIVKSSGNAAFDRSAEEAVAKVDRFERLREVPADVFERNFRRLRLVFSPDDLRL